MQKENKDKLEIRIWSINLIIAWLLLSAITFADFGASIIPLLETGSRNDVSGDLAASIFVLIPLPYDIGDRNTEHCLT